MPWAAAGVARWCGKLCPGEVQDEVKWGEMGSHSTEQLARTIDPWKPKTKRYDLNSIVWIYLSGQCLDDIGVNQSTTSVVCSKRWSPLDSASMRLEQQ